MERRIGTDICQRQEDGPEAEDINGERFKLLGHI